MPFKVSFVFLLVSALTLPATAQTSFLTHPFYGELGLAVPTDHGSSAGGTATFGASFLRRRGLTVSAEIRASSFDTGYDVPGANDDKGEVYTPLTFGLDGRYRPVHIPFFIGASLGAAQIDAATDRSGSVTKLGYALETGYEFSKRIYAVVRYQSTLDDLAIYRAVTVGFGYRF